MCCLAYALYLLLAVLDLYFGRCFTLAVLGFAWIGLGLACGLSWLAFADAFFAFAWPDLGMTLDWPLHCLGFAFARLWACLDFVLALTWFAV